MRGLTYTRVNRMLNEANAILRDEQGREAVEHNHASPCAARLFELEDKPPKWLEAALRRRPALTADPRAVLAWRRAALAIDDGASSPSSARWISVSISTSVSPNVRAS